MLVYAHTCAPTCSPAACVASMLSSSFRGVRCCAHTKKNTQNSLLTSVPVTRADIDKYIKSVSPLLYLFQLYITSINIANTYTHTDTDTHTQTHTNIQTTVTETASSLTPYCFCMYSNTNISVYITNLLY